MKKIIFILVVLWLGLSAFANSVKAETKTETITLRYQHWSGNNDINMLKQE